MSRASAGVHVFVVDLEGLALEDSDRHHLERVLRLRPGDEVTVRRRWLAVCRFGAELEDDVDGHLAGVSHERGGRVAN